jgi:hypothetical protein
MAINRLPNPNQDKSTWGTILNGYLRVTLSSDGGLNNWTTATRPTAPDMSVTGINTTLNIVEQWNGTAWKTLLSSQATSAVLAENGLSIVAGKVVLGGALTQPTTVTTTPVNTLSVKGLVTGVTGDKYLVQDADGVLKTITSSPTSSTLKPAWRSYNMAWLANTKRRTAGAYSYHNGVNYTSFAEDPRFKGLNEIQDGRKTHILKPSWGYVTEGGYTRIVDTEWGGAWSVANQALVLSKCDEAWNQIGGTMTSDNLKAVIANPAWRTTAVNAAVADSVAMGCKGICWDIEETGVISNPTLKTALGDFFAEASTKCQAAGIKMSITMYAVSKPSNVYDYGYFYNRANKYSSITIMAYDQHYEYYDDVEMIHGVAPVTEASLRACIKNLLIQLDYDYNKAHVGIASTGVRSVGIRSAANLSAANAQVATRDTTDFSKTEQINHPNYSNGGVNRDVMLQVTTDGKMILDKNGRVQRGGTLSPSWYNHMELSSAGYTVNAFFADTQTLCVLRDVCEQEGIKYVCLWRLGETDWFDRTLEIDNKTGAKIWRVLNHAKSEPQWGTLD